MSTLDPKQTMLRDKAYSVIKGDLFTYGYSMAYLNRLPEKIVLDLYKAYLLDKEKYSFDINGIIVGGKYKKIIKDEKSGKITVEKGNDGNLGLEIDINIINRKD